MNAIKATIASIVVINIVLITIIDELTSLEKMIVTVQFDMTWVHDDMRGIHNMIENVVERVCELRDATIKVKGLHEQVSANASLWKSGKEMPRIWRNTARSIHGTPYIGRKFTLIMTFSFNRHNVPCHLGLAMILVVMKMLVAFKRLNPSTTMHINILSSPEK